MNWKNILATALVTGFVTVATGMVLFWWQTKTPELTYNYIESIPFDDADSRLFIQQFEITNSGNEIAEDITLSLAFPESIIENFNIRISNGIRYEESISAGQIFISLESLNPSESFSLSVLLRAQTLSRTDPIVSLRANGITGTKIGNVGTSVEPIISIALGAAYTGIFAFMLSIKAYRDRLTTIATGLITGRNVLSGNQKDNIASILSLHGFPEKAREYLNYGSSRKYWVEADLLAAEVIASDVSTKRRMLNVLAHLADEVSMATSSRAIVYYNIARILKSINGDYVPPLNLAKQIDLREVDQRLKQDPIFAEPQPTTQTELAEVAVG